MVKYVLNQEEHHKKKTFKQEYLEFLEKFEIPFEEKYLFEYLDDKLAAPTEPVYSGW